VNASQGQNHPQTWGFAYERGIMVTHS